MLGFLLLYYGGVPDQVQFRETGNVGSAGWATEPKTKGKDVKKAAQIKGQMSPVLAGCIVWQKGGSWRKDIQHLDRV